MQMDKLIHLYSRGRFIAPTADLSALSGCSYIRIIVLKVIIGPIRAVTVPASDQGNPATRGHFRSRERAGGGTATRHVLKTGTSSGIIFPALTCSLQMWVSPHAKGEPHVQTLTRV